eukprot:comp12360_c0_seq1/m.7239 comp12360_c0_seq1/g.7239  ORF comp12360_c0_seq1/g.7239 comp12360_c0_seq1/m.7239 type:complete len:473 (-) comp12360_c0_seq1:460-1878(-)
MPSVEPTTNMDAFWPAGTNEPTEAELPEVLQHLASKHGAKLTSRELAEKLDAADPLAKFKDQFYNPTLGSMKGASPEYIAEQGADAGSIYFCGNSLGIQPKVTAVLVEEEMAKWRNVGVQGHLYGPRPWVRLADTLSEDMAPIVGAETSEVVVMNTLTVNLHMMMCSFYRPTADRYKILIESKAFPSDHYAVLSQVKLHGYDESAMVIVDSEAGSAAVYEALEKYGKEIALVMLPGIHYYTGLVYDMEGITAEAHKHGCVMGWDLAHAAGNIILKLHDWDVDFACWCTYKYMNTGPGCMAGAFVHKKHHSNPELPRLLGWWSHDVSSRFKMDNKFVPQAGTLAYAVSNAPVMDCVSVRGSLDVFKQTSMQQLRAKSVVLTGYLEALLHARLPEGKVKVLTPKNPAQRGCQLSLLFDEAVRPIFTFIESRGVIVDIREPNVIRVAPTPLYNGFVHVWMFVQHLVDAVDSTSSQ